MTAIAWKPRELPTHGQMTLPRHYFTDPAVDAGQLRLLRLSQ